MIFTKHTTKPALNIEVYTDGSAKNNGQENAYGGWAYIVLVNGGLAHSDYGYLYNTTNQQMELFAAIEACIYLDNRYSSFDKFVIYSDSAYLVNCVNNNWYSKWLETGWKNSKGEPVANKSYWNLLIPYFDDYRFTFEKVKGHSNVKYNNLADELAQRAAEVGRGKIENSSN